MYCLYLWYFINTTAYHWAPFPVSCRAPCLNHCLMQLLQNNPTNVTSYPHKLDIIQAATNPSKILAKFVKRRFCFLKPANEPQKLSSHLINLVFISPESSTP